MQRLGEGRTADIFVHSDRLVLKLYFRRFSREWVDHAAEVAAAVAAKGIRTPAVHGVVTHGDRHGIVIDRIPGRTMFDELLARPDDVEAIAMALADLHLDIHARSVDRLPDHHPHLAGRIERAPFLPPDHRRAALDRLANLPSSDRLHHGDLHPANVMITPDGEGVAFDWDGAKRGAPAADVARAFFLLSDWALAPGPFDHDLIQPMRNLLSETYLDTYLAGSSLTRADVGGWMLPVAAGRLDEHIEEERELVLAQVDRLSRQAVERNRRSGYSS